MNSDLKLALPYQLLNACACAYGVDDKTGLYTPPAINANIIGWQKQNVFVVHGNSSSFFDAALVGIIKNLWTESGNKDAIVVAFQGTIGLTTYGGIKDWLTDFDCTPVPFLEGKQGDMVHKGIYDSVNAILNPIMKLIDQLQNQSDPLPIYITGHSKGAGMSGIAAAILNNKHGYKIDSVYTFASPMIGNQSFTNNFPANIKVMRFENYIDVIPFLMPSPDFIGTLEKVAVKSHHKTELEIFINLLRFIQNKHQATGYVPLGILYFIKEDREIIAFPNQPGLPNSSADALAQTLSLNGLAGFEDVAAAHSHGCGSKESINSQDCYLGYMGGVGKTSGICT